METHQRSCLISQANQWPAAPSIHTLYSNTFPPVYFYIRAGMEWQLLCTNKQVRYMYTVYGTHTCLCEYARTHAHTLPITYRCIYTQTDTCRNKYRLIHPLCTHRKKADIRTHACAHAGARTHTHTVTRVQAIT